MANDVTVHSETTDETYRVRLLAPGDRYGLDGKLRADKAMVEFYDVSGRKKFSIPGGLFVTRYELSTLLDHDRGTGLDLHGGLPYWKVDAKAFDQAMTGLLAGRRDLP